MIDVFRTEVIPYTTEEYNSNDYFIGEEVVTQQGADGLRSFYRVQKYVNGVATGEFTGQEIPEVTTQPTTHRIAIGTKPHDVTVTVLSQGIISVATTGFMFPAVPAMGGKTIIKIKLAEHVVTGSWFNPNVGPSMYFQFKTPAGADTTALNFFGWSGSYSYPIGTPIQLTYLP